MYKKNQAFVVPSEKYYGRCYNIYELKDETNKIAYAIDDIYGSKGKGKRVKVLDDEFEPDFCYTLRQISREEFLRLRIKSLENELHEERLLKWRYERYNQEKKDLIEEIKSLLFDGDILAIKEILQEETQEEVA